MEEQEIDYPLVKDLKKRAMIKALENSLGVVQTAIKQVGIARSTHYDWMSSISVRYDADYRDAVESISNIALDFVESQMFQKIQGVKTTIDGESVFRKEPDSTCIIFYLKTKGKNRGYIERLQTEEIGNREPIQVHIIDPNAEDRCDD